MPTNKYDKMGLLPCRCCGSLTISEYDSYEICCVCNWEYDDQQYDNPDYGGGANEMSLNQAKATSNRVIK